MVNKIIVGVVSVALLAAGGVAFAETASVQGETTITATPVATPTTVAAKIACVGAAVNTRETALDSAMVTFTASENAAYTKRASELSSAYAKTTTYDLKKGVKLAWSNFSTSMRTARQAWQSARTSSWKTFRSSSLACKAPVGVSDSDNASLEASGL